MTDEDGRFRINRVAESTGIPEATLRAWERRYHVPKPSRTPSGYRLYSPDDVAQVRKMRDLCESGVAPADAAKEILEARKLKQVDAPARSLQRAVAAPETPRVAGAVAPIDPASSGQAESRLMEMVEPEHTNTAGVLSLAQA